MLKLKPRAPQVQVRQKARPKRCPPFFPKKTATARAAQVADAAQVVWQTAHAIKCVPFQIPQKRRK